MNVIQTPFLDYDALVGRHGRTRWYDERKWLTMRMPIAAYNLVHLASVAILTNTNHSPLCLTRSYIGT
jgi:hypothetical protein